MPPASSRPRSKAAPRPVAQVRPARRADLRAISALFATSERLHAELHPRYFRGEGQLDPRLVETLQQPGELRTLLVAVRDATVVGFVHVEVLVPRRSASATLGRRGHIDSLVVAPGARRSGCGRSLLEAAAQWARARAAEELLLTVWAGNREAERFYERLGFDDVSSIKRLLLAPR